MNSPRRIEEYLEPLYTEENKDKQEKTKEEPVFFGHMISLPLTSGKTFEVDPKAIISMDEHRTESGVTVLRVKNDNFTYFVDRPKSIVLKWLALR